MQTMQAEREQRKSRSTLQPISVTPAFRSVHNDDVIDVCKCKFYFDCRHYSSFSGESTG